MVDDVQSDEVYAPWRKFSKVDEYQRLKVVEARIERKKRSIEEAQAEKKLIMQRAIRRMRRAQGKE